MWHSRSDNCLAVTAVTVCALAAAACGSVTPASTTSPGGGSTPAPTLSAAAAPVATPPGSTPWPFPGQPENCGPITIAQDGNVTPALCPDGRPNVAAITFFAKVPSQLLALGPGATAADVMAAACADLNAPAPNAGTIPLVTTEATLAFAENNWDFGAVTSPGQINQQMVAGACSAATPVS